MTEKKGKDKSNIVHIDELPAIAARYKVDNALSEIEKSPEEELEAHNPISLVNKDIIKKVESAEEEVHDLKETLVQVIKDFLYDSPEGEQKELLIKQDLKDILSEIFNSRPSKMGSPDRVLEESISLRSDDFDFLNELNDRKNTWMVLMYVEHLLCDWFDDEFESIFSNTKTDFTLGLIATETNIDINLESGEIDIKFKLNVTLEKVLKLDDDEE